MGLISELQIEAALLQHHNQVSLADSLRLRGMGIVWDGGYRGGITFRDTHKLKEAQEKK